MLARLCELNWQKIGKKRTYLRGRFCVHILKNTTQNNIVDQKHYDNGSLQRNRKKHLAL